MEEARELFRSHGKNTKPFSLKGIRCFSRVVSVVDGDTLNLVVPLHDSFYRFSARLSGIDTCEMKSRDMEAKSLALQARDLLFQLVTGQPIQPSSTKKDIEDFLDDNPSIVFVECLEFDKYGRLLVNVYHDETAKLSFSDIIKGQNLGYTYSGARKLTEAEQINKLG